MATISPPKIDMRPEQPYLGIRSLAPFKGLSKVIDQLSQQLTRWVAANHVETSGSPFLRYHVIDMHGMLDITYAVPLHSALPGNGLVTPGVLPAGRYASLVYSGGGISGNRALIEWVRGNGLQFDSWDTEQGDNFRSRYETFLTDPRLEPRKRRWQFEVAIKLTDND